MAETMTRADALRDLIARVESVASDFDRFDAHGASARIFQPDAYSAFGRALDGSLDFVSYLEAPLRERGWRRQEIVRLDAEGSDPVEWFVRWTPPTRGNLPLFPYPSGSTEPRARLLAVLRALLWEADNARPR